MFWFLVIVSMFPFYFCGAWCVSKFGGLCSICRQLLQKDDLITYSSESPFKVDIKNNVTESSKVSKLFEFLQRILNTSSEKSIVFSQWTSFFDLLENPLRRRGIGFLRYDGKLTQKQREKVLDEFNETREKRVSKVNLNNLTCLVEKYYHWITVFYSNRIVSGFVNVTKSWWCGFELNCSLKCFHYGMLCLIPFYPVHNFISSVLTFCVKCRIHGGTLQLRSKQ